VGGREGEMELFSEDAAECAHLLLRGSRKVECGHSCLLRTGGDGSEGDGQEHELDRWAVREADLAITENRMGENFADTTQPPPVTTDETRQSLRTHSIGPCQQRR